MLSPYKHGENAGRVSDLPPTSSHKGAKSSKFRASYAGATLISFLECHWGDWSTKHVYDWEIYGQVIGEIIVLLFHVHHQNLRFRIICHVHAHKPNPTSKFEVAYPGWTLTSNMTWSIMIHHPFQLEDFDVYPNLCTQILSFLHIRSHFWTWTQKSTRN